MNYHGPVGITLLYRSHTGVQVQAHTPGQRLLIEETGPGIFLVIGAALPDDLHELQRVQLVTPDCRIEGSVTWVGQGRFVCTRTNHD